MALAIALIFGMVIMVMAATALSVATSGVRKADTDQDWNGALSAAYAGIQEYQSRLANDNTYQKYGNKNAALTKSSGSADLVNMPSAANSAFDVTKGGEWATVPGMGSTASFRYEVDTSKYAATGIIRVRSTGRVGTETRSVIADLRQDGFIDYLYFTNYEIQDPAQSGASTTCVKYAYQGRAISGCNDIAFGNGDVINGPAHSNDTMRICSATFSTKVTSSNPATTGLRYTPKDSTNASCTGQKFPGSTNQPGLASTIDVPTSLSASKRQTQTGLSDVTSPGCLYTGPTNIVFTSDGYMRVKSPYTKFVQTNSAGTVGNSSAIATGLCGTPGTGTDQLGSATGAKVAVPNDNLIYVQNIPGSGDVNYTAATGDMTASSCGNNHVGYPLSGETVPTTTGGYNSGVSGYVCAYGARSGDAFVKGQVKGKVTIATDNYLYATGDITYSDPTTDVLGLIGTNSVFVYNPVKLTNGSYVSMLGDSGREIDAAILSSSHSFAVQNFDRGGERGTLTVNGSIAQNFRGIVHSGSNGYIKAYGYDGRLRYTAPPKFISPVTTTYNVTTVTESKTAYAADGTAQ